MRFFWKGALFGFIFGIAGIWLLAAFSLALPFIEVISGPLFMPGRFVASVLTGNSASTATTIVLFLINGAFYALIGAVIEYGYQYVRSYYST